MNVIPIRYCTRCGKIIRNYKIYQFELLFPFPFVRKDQYDFCQECYDMFKDFMTSGGMIRYKSHGVHAHGIQVDNIKDLLKDDIHTSNTGYISETVRD